MLEMWEREVDMCMGDILNDMWTLVKLLPQKNDFWGKSCTNVHLSFIQDISKLPYFQRISH